MSQVSFNRYKGFCIPKNPPSGEVSDASSEAAFDLLHWDLDLNVFVSDVYPIDLLARPKQAKLSKKEQRRQRKQDQRKNKKRLSKNKKKQDSQDSEEPLISQLVIENKQSGQNDIAQVRGLISTLLKGADNPNKILDFYDVRISKDDILNLNDDNWLNDNNLSYFYECLERFQLPGFIANNELIMHSKQAGDFKHSVLLFKPAVAFLLLRYPDPAGLKGTLPHIEMAKFVFLPMNDNEDVDVAEGGSHWSLLVLNMLERTAYVYDTVSDEDNDSEEAELLVTNINKYLKSVGALQISTTIAMNTPQQVNGGDCGVHVLQITALLVSRILNIQENGSIDFEINTPMSAIKGREFILRTILALLNTS